MNLFFYFLNQHCNLLLKHILYRWGKWFFFFYVNWKCFNCFTTDILLLLASQKVFSLISLRCQRSCMFLFWIYFAEHIYFHFCWKCYFCSFLNYWQSYMLDYPLTMANLLSCHTNVFSLCASSYKPNFETTDSTESNKYQQKKSRSEMT